MYDIKVKVFPLAITSCHQLYSSYKDIIKTFEIKEISMTLDIIDEDSVRRLKEWLELQYDFNVFIVYHNKDYLVNEESLTWFSMRQFNHPFYNTGEFVSAATYERKKTVSPFTINPLVSFSNELRAKENEQR